MWCNWTWKPWINGKRPGLSKHAITRNYKKIISNSVSQITQKFCQSLLLLCKTALYIVLMLPPCHFLLYSSNTIVTFTEENNGSSHSDSKKLDHSTICNITLYHRFNSIKHLKLSQLCCIFWPDFGCLQPPNAGHTLFLQFSDHFSSFCIKIWRKIVKKQQQFLPAFVCCKHSLKSC